MKRLMFFPPGRGGSVFHHTNNGTGAGDTLRLLRDRVERVRALRCTVALF